jgi:hypothetical protein
VVRETDAEGTFPSLPSRLASLLTLFRLAQPELFAYFEDEQVRYVEIATSWLTTLLSKEMWLGDVLRLWGEFSLLALSTTAPLTPSEHARMVASLSCLIAN